MLKNHSIICFAPTDWWGMNPSCTTHIMRKLAEKNTVLYINPFSSDILGERKNIGKRISRKLKSAVKCLRQPEKNIYVFSPVFLPLQGNQIIDGVNNMLLRVQLKHVCRLTGMSKPILWVENPRAADMLNWFEPKIIVYHFSDLFSKCRYIGNKKKLREREEYIANKSNIIICVSQTLFNLKSSQKDNNSVFYLPHGVDFKLFRNAIDNNIRLKETEHIPRPVAGYYGTMTANNDIELLLYCAQHLPWISFVLAGKITSGDYSELSKLPNMYLLGKIPYSKIPSLCASFDVCLLQWKITDWIRHCNPLKMMEYMASGKPIVSVGIEEAMLYSDIISIAHNKREFCNAIQWELENDTLERSNRRVEIAREHNWDCHIKQLSKWIEARI